LAVEKGGTANLGFKKANGSSNSSTDLATLGVSLNGLNLLQALSNTSFKGLTGDYFFVDRCWVVPHHDNGTTTHHTFE